MEHINNIQFKIKKAATSTNSLIGALEKETAYGKTENGADTFENSGSSLLDFYAQAGSMRNNVSQALTLFKQAFAEDRQSAIRILFYLRDVRGGQGERNLFRVCLEYIGTTFPEIFDKIIEFVPEYGRWDDLFFNNEKVFDFIAKQIEKDTASERPSLLAKWLPTINASSVKTVAKARFFAGKIGLTDIGYRKTVREIRKKIKAVEELMSAKKWEEVEYSKVPSRASKIYKNAFTKHDAERYSKFIEKAVTGEVKINASTLYPYELYDLANNDYSKTVEALWNQLPDYTMGKNAIVVADTSDSMSGRPMSVSVSLALYFAERNVGQFKDYFISFSATPKLHKIKGATLRDKMNSVELGDVANTNLQAVFELILDTATTNAVPASELPATIYIISDMEFDGCVVAGRKTNYEAIKEKYIAAGYEIPNIVFWNVDARSGKNLPVRQDENNVSLVSGFSPVIFKLATQGKTPLETMNETINSERYSKINI